MNKKIIIIVLSLFSCLFLFAAILYISNKDDQNPAVINEVEELDHYLKIDDANLNSSNADVHTLVKYSKGLYAKATDNYEIEGDLLVSLGTINKLTDSDNIPIYNLETNNKDFLNASIIRSSYKELIIQKDEEI